MYQQPAGVQVRKPEGIRKKPSQPSNVERYLQREAQLEDASKVVRANEKMVAAAQWEVEAMKKLSVCERTREAKRTDEEFEAQNEELKAHRRAKLIKFYQQQKERWDKELSARGLAVSRDRL